MPSEANLYGFRRPRNTPKELSSSTSLEFSSSLSSLLTTSKATSKTTTGRPRPSRTKGDIFTAHNKNSKKRAAKDLEEDDALRSRTKGIEGLDEGALHRSKRKMEQKAKLYARMKRGDLEAADDADALVDFDRKWAEKEAQGVARDESSDSESEDDNRNEVVDYEDEYGRARRGTRAEAERMERRKANKALGAEELDRMSARPKMPEKLIYGDTVQTLAFNPDEPIMEKMEEIARKRDRSLTPPDMKHYEADKEIRIKGVGFYSFSKDEKLRGEEMEALEKERLETERVRNEREDKKTKRKKEIEERRKAIGEKRAKKQADVFLEGLTANIEGKDNLGAD